MDKPKSNHTPKVAAARAGHPRPDIVSPKPADKGDEGRYLTITKRSDVSWKEALAKGFTGRL